MDTNGVALHNILPSSVATSHKSDREFALGFVVFTPRLYCRFFWLLNILFDNNAIFSRLGSIASLFIHCLMTCILYGTSVDSKHASNNHGQECPCKSHVEKTQKYRIEWKEMMLCESVCNFV
mmetsp:Transcript_17627/g.43988  ORF Transcript_17627/g.43988 Transcript_17627/m.43988 type:complete len:122 (-) Transcript_17627:613-978(-)